MSGPMRRALRTLLPLLLLAVAGSFAVRTDDAGPAPSAEASAPSVDGSALSPAAPSGTTFTATSGLPTMATDELPPEALDTLTDIAAGGPYDFDRDDTVFQNREGLLPDRPRGHYREYTVITPGEDTRGARRLVAGADGEVFYTDDHYDSFREIVP